MCFVPFFRQSRSRTFNFSKNAAKKIRAEVSSSFEYAYIFIRFIFNYVVLFRFNVLIIRYFSVSVLVTELKVA